MKEMQASQTDKKDEFRKYLERKKVVEVLTKTLTDLFELETRPDDALLYVHTKIGEHVKKAAPTTGAAPVNDAAVPAANVDSNAPAKTAQHENAAAAAMDVVTAGKE